MLDGLRLDGLHSTLRCSRRSGSGNSTAKRPISHRKTNQIFNVCEVLRSFLTLLQFDEHFSCLAYLYFSVASAAELLGVIFSCS